MQSPPPRPITLLDPSISTEALIDHIITHHHRPLDEELPRLRALANEVARVHGGSVHLSVRDHFAALEQNLLPHIEREERIVFPLLAAHDPRAREPLQAMSDQHHIIGEILRELRRVTGDYRLPEAACGSWRALWQGLEVLDFDLHEHIHLENSALFPRATCAPRAPDSPRSTDP